MKKGLRHLAADVLDVSRDDVQINALMKKGLRPRGPTAGTVVCAVQINALMKKGLRQRGEGDARLLLVSVQINALMKKGLRPPSLRT